MWVQQERHKEGGEQKRPKDARKGEWSIAQKDGKELNGFKPGRYRCGMQVLKGPQAILRDSYKSLTQYEGEGENIPLREEVKCPAQMLPIQGTATDRETKGKTKDIKRATNGGGRGRYKN